MYTNHHKKTMKSVWFGAALFLVNFLTYTVCAQGQLLTSLVKTVEDLYTTPTPLNIKILPGSKLHNSSAQAIFSCALTTTHVGQDALYFAGSARRAGFTGDIVVGVLPGMTDAFMQRLKEYNTTIYTVNTECVGKVGTNIQCHYGSHVDVPVTLFRYYVYQYWAIKYSKQSVILLADFRDVIFQTNPFNYKTTDWKPPHFDLTVFQEAHPNRVINRDIASGTNIQNCYGKEVFRMIGSNTISSSGVVFGSRDAIVAYSYLLSKQYEPKNGRLSNTTNTACLTFGVDQAFHNYLLYSDILSRYMRVKIFQQGEGPVNTLGGFYGEKKILKAQLAEWKILRGEAPYQYVHNWNGELSPIVHQLDRFLGTEMLGGLRSHLAIFQHLA